MTPEDLISALKARDCGTAAEIRRLLGIEDLGDLRSEVLILREGFDAMSDHDSLIADLVDEIDAYRATLETILELGDISKIQYVAENALLREF